MSSYGAVPFNVRLFPDVLEYLLPDSSFCQHKFHDRELAGQEMVAPEAVEVAAMEPAEVAEFSRTNKCFLNFDQSRHLALESTLAGWYVAATPCLSSVIGQCFQEYRKRRK